MATRNRKTSRKSKRRTTKKRLSSKKKRSTKRKSTRGVTARKGYLNYKDLKAKEYRGSEPVFKGRIQVQRGSGFVEYPAPEQFGRIAREEGVSKDHVDKAFGHMKPLHKNVGQKKRFTVKRGTLYAPETPKQEEVLLEEVPTPAGLEHRYGGRVKLVAAQVGDKAASLLEPAQAAREARRLGFTQGQFDRAFGHLGKGMGSGSTKSGPTQYGPKVMKLGHRDEGGSLRPGVAVGQLVLYDRRDGRVVWAANAVMETAETADPQIRIAGRNIKWKPALKRAQERNIPELAFLQAFGFMLAPDVRSKAYRQFS